MNLTGAVIAQIAVQACQRLQIVAFVISVNDIQSLSSMGMIQMQAVSFVGDTSGLWLDRSGDLSGKDNRHKQQMANILRRQGQAKHSRNGWIATSDLNFHCTPEVPFDPSSSLD